MKAVREGFVLVPCTGAAHSNPHIDNCGICAPRWGWVEVPAGVKTLAEHRERVALGRLAQARYVALAAAQARATRVNNMNDGYGRAYWLSVAAVRAARVLERRDSRLAEEVMF